MSKFTEEEIDKTIEILEALARLTEDNEPYAIITIRELRNIASIVSGSVDELLEL